MRSVPRALNTVLFLCFCYCALLLPFLGSSYAVAANTIALDDASNAAPPSDWRERIAQAQMLYSPTEPEQAIQTMVGNGYVATQISSDSIFIGGVFSGPAIDLDNPSHRARIPSMMNLTLAQATTTACAIDIERGVYFRRSKVMANNEAQEIEQRWYAHRALRNLLVHEIHLLKGTSDSVKVCVEQNFGPMPSADMDFKQVNTEFDETIQWFGTIAEPETSTSELVQVAVVFTNNNNTNGGSDGMLGNNTFCISLAPNEPYVLLAVFRTSLDNDIPPGTDILQQAIEDYQTFAKMARTPSSSSHVDSTSHNPRHHLNNNKKAGVVSMAPNDDATATAAVAATTTSALLASHIEAWAAIWQSGIEVSPSTNLGLAQAINSSLYYILSSVTESWEYSLSPGSLSSNSYHGHVFWDVETWMYPCLLMLYPSLAKSVLDYRVHRIPEAEQKAQSYNKGYQGAMFPWESAFTGVETCPTSAPTGQLEQHISGDIVFAMRQFFYTHNMQQLVNNEKNYLATHIYPLVTKVAQFWSSRVTPRPDNNTLYDILGVIPPDEYAVNVSNSIYTNAVAQISLEFAIELCQLTGGSDCDIARWSDIAAKLYFPPPSLLSASASSSSSGELLLVHPEYEGYSGEVIKQADVVLLNYPLMWEGLNPDTDEGKQTIRNDLIFYQNRTDAENGPAMTWGMYAVGWLQQQEPEMASALFKRAYANAQAPFSVWTETPTGGAINFITGAGGFLQSVMFGYGGLRVQNKTALMWNPVLMDSVSTVKFRGVNYLGNILDIEYNDSIVTIYVRPFSNPNDQHIASSLYAITGAGNDDVYQLVAGRAVSFAIGQFYIMTIDDTV